MRSTLTSLFLLAPILAVPMLAIFGVPEFTSVVASPQQRQDDLLIDEHFEKSSSGDAPGFGDASPSSDSGVAESISFNENSGATAFDNGTETRPGKWGNATASAATHATPAGPWDSSAEQSLATNAADPFTGAAVANPADIQQAAFTEDAARAMASQMQPYRRNDGAARPGAVPNKVLPPRGSATMASGTPSLTWQSAVERLNALEIRTFRLEPGARAGQFLFVCSYTMSNEPRVSYHFEAEASEPLKAVEKVLDQIEATIAQTASR
jgi:hypothetical protein